METVRGQEAGQIINLSWDKISLANPLGLSHIAPERVRHIEASGGRQPPGV